MSRTPITDPQFLATLQAWSHTQPEILLLIRYSHAGGNKDFEFFSSFQNMVERMHALPPLTSVIAFRQPQLPLRGVVDEEFIARCLCAIPEGAEHLVLERTPRVYGKASWFHYSAGETLAELREALEDSRGVAVYVGPYPPWLVDSDEVISAVVPDDNGATGPGAY